MLGTIKGRFKLANISAKAADLLFPPHCPLCNEPTLEIHRLCDACWPELENLLAPFCDCCSEPLPPSPTGYDGPLMCGDCIGKPPAYSKLRAPLTYTPAARKLVLSFKRYGQDGLVNLFQPHIQRAASDLLPTSDLIVPVPLHWTRLWKRGYNQAALMANSLDLSQSSASLVVDLLKRVKRTQPQGKSSAVNRYANLKKAIEIAPKYQDLVVGKNVLLVDDVCASGATLSTCAKVLKRAGAQDVNCLVLAKSLRNTMSDSEELDF